MCYNNNNCITILQIDNLITVIRTILLTRYMLQLLGKNNFKPCGLNIFFYLITEIIKHCTEIINNILYLFYINSIDNWYIIMDRTWVCHLSSSIRHSTDIS